MSEFDWASAVSGNGRSPTGAPVATSATPAGNNTYDWAAAVSAPGHNAGHSPATLANMIKISLTHPLTGETSGPVQNMAIGFGHGLMDAVYGAEQLALKALNPLPFLASHSGGIVKLTPKGMQQQQTGVIPHALASVNQSAQEGNDIFTPFLNRHPWTGGIGNLAGNLAATAPLMYAGGEATDALLPEAGSSLLSSLSRGAAKNAISGAVGGATQYVAPGSGASHFTNALEGALLNAGIPLAMQSLSGLAKGTFGGVRKIAQGIRPTINPEIQAAATATGITPSVGELSGSVPYQKLETALEHVPFSGMGKVRAANAQQFKTAAQNILKPFDVGEADPNQLIREGAQKVLNDNRTTATGLYNKVQELAARRRTGVAAPLADGESPSDLKMPATQDAAKNILDRFSGNEDLNAEPDFLKTVRPYTEAPPRTYEAARKLRSQLGHMQAKAGFGTPEALAYGDLRAAVEKDMDSYALSHGADLSKAYQTAQDFYKQNVVPFKSIAPLKSLVSGKMDTDTIMGSFIKNDRPELAGKLMSKLPPNAQNAVRLNVLQKGFDKANLGGEREGSAFDPRRFATYWENLGTTRNSLFGPQDRTLIDGYAKLARAMPRTADYSEFMHKPTGLKAAVLGSGAIEGAAFITHPHVAIPGIVSIIGLRRLLTEPWGQNLLLRAATTENPSSLSALAKVAIRKFGTGINTASRYSAPPILNQMHQPNTVQQQMQQ